MALSILILLALTILGFIHLIANFTLLSPRSCVLYRDKTVIEQPIRLTGLSQRLVREANAFIAHHHDSPFFLFFSDVKVHTALFTGDEFRNRSGKGDFVDNVEELVSAYTLNCYPSLSDGSCLITLSIGCRIGPLGN